ncbi:MAG: alpha/beta hydrolase, partial [Armatimonadetes bacterium]|nr:alpha/beta hydrolase [Armatimonadota bacterium]
MKRAWLATIGLLILLAIATTSLMGLAVLQVSEKVQPFELKENLIYGSNERNELDLFLPKGESKNLRPAVLVIHGGAWRSGDKRQLRTIAELFARRGYVAAAINYRLA